VVSLAIFDLENTLFATEEMHRESFAAAAHAIAPDANDVDELVGRCMGRSEIHARACIVAALGRLGAVTDLASFGLRKEAEFFTRLALATAADLEIPGGRALVEHAHGRGLRLALCTGGTFPLFEALKRRFPYLDLFDRQASFFCADQAAEASSKPDPLGYATVLRRTAVSGSAAMAVEDTLAGFLAATGAGIERVAVRPSSGAERLALAEVVASHPKAILYDEWPPPEELFANVC
jgi:HAD superfamily hydrolase (TIGR01509 family)